ncbi:MULTISPECIES: peroxidase family protein [Cyanophyceae]|uniref:Heme peroxidase family protein n=1 Tax=Leptolyngbya subtilissima DQ-A4 TaxID=2933933 RepID=A0ABV0K2W8_9CYAN|nr:heme peroxidase family protein [Nodosilinea sp. FACHB-141]MBD2113100.1 peroxidase [Nodosilinea sp. FACHB-141]
MTRHGQMYLRDAAPPRFRVPARGRFGRMFRCTRPFAQDTPAIRQALMELGKAEGIMDPGPTNNPDNPAIPAGFTFLGQFIDHDLTFDPTSSLERQSDPEAIENFRTPSFELDSVYGAGPTASPFLYDNRPENRGKLLIDSDRPHDLPRNSQGTALLGDPRNDENLIVSQLHLAFVKFHNAMIDKLKADGVNPGQLFDEAQKLVRWHYQWIVLHEFLPLLVGQNVVDTVLQRGRRFYSTRWRREPYIPVEFSVAAYRFGHSQVRGGYRINQNFAAAIFAAPGSGGNDLSSGKPLPPERVMDWQNFFKVNETATPQLSQRIDATISRPLFQLPFIPPNMASNPASLAQRNLLRHLTFGLPSGQTVAGKMGIAPLSTADLADVAAISTELAHNTPLWFYVLREADKRADGRSLGPVGGRIVAEVFIGLLQSDELSYLCQEPNWTPRLGTGGDFKMADLLKFAGVAEPPVLPTPPAPAPAPAAETPQPAEVSAN